MKMIHKIFLILVTFLFGPNLVLGAPNISGVTGAFIDKQEVTISGSGFGTKSPANPQLWVPFDTDKNPSTLGVVDAWLFNEAGISFTSNGGWGASGACQVLNAPAVSAGLAAGFETWNFNDPGQKSYIHRRSKRMYNTSAMDGNGGLKAMKMDYNETYGDNVVFNRTTNQWISQNFGDSSYYYFDADNNYPDWLTEETIIQANTVANAGADVDTYIQYVRTGNSPESEWITFWDNGTEPFNAITFWRYASSSPMTAGQAPEYWDDLYVDNTWARIIIGDASTLSASIHREIQIPLAWASTSITANINKGTFANGATAYLYIVDQNGEFNSNGFPIVINSSDAIAPNAPIGLTIL